jgi:hypothetical protein
VIPATILATRLSKLINAVPRDSDPETRVWIDEAAVPERIESAAVLALATITPHVDALCVERRMRAAVTERAAETWPFKMIWEGNSARWRELEPAQIPLAFAAAYDNASWSWPVNLALRDVATLLEQTRDPLAKRLAKAFLDGTLGPLQGADLSTFKALDAADLSVDDELREALAQWDLRACVIVASAELDLRESQRRPAIALDAGAVHHELLSGWRDLPKDRRLRKTPVRDGWAEILYPGKQLGLRLSVQDLPERIVHAVREWKHWQGLRHWAALQLLFSDAGRTGRIRWTLEAHLDALGYADRTRRDPKLRATVAAEVEALTRMELAVYHPDGTVRLRGPVLAVTQRGEAMRGSEWTLEGMELVIHPILYEGVRRSSGELGRLWAPAPLELARIDHVRHPHALALGLILPIRWRWDLTEQTDHITLTGAKLLEAAGIEIKNQKPGRAWLALEQNLEELQRVDGVGHFEWDSAAWSLLGRCRLYQPQWARERMVHGLLPSDAPPSPSILTGGELSSWRRNKGWTQEDAATALGVSRYTIIRAEASPDSPLKHSLHHALVKLRQS